MSSPLPTSEVAPSRPPEGRRKGEKVRIAYWAYLAYSAYWPYLAYLPNYKLQLQLPPSIMNYKIMN